MQMLCRLETFLVSCSAGDPAIESENRSVERSVKQSPSFALNHLPPERRLTLLGLMAVAFFTTCGGPFGLEPLPAAGDLPVVARSFPVKRSLHPKIADGRAAPTFRSSREPWTCGLDYTRNLDVGRHLVAATRCGSRTRLR